MAVSVVEETGDTTTTDGNEQSLFEEEDAGVFFVRLDIDDMAAADYLVVKEYISARAASTQRLMEGSPMTYRWDAGPIIELPHRSIPVNCTYEVTIQRVAGSDFDVVWSLIEVG